MGTICFSLVSDMSLVLCIANTKYTKYTNTITNTNTNKMQIPPQRPPDHTTNFSAEDFNFNQFSTELAILSFQRPEKNLHTAGKLLRVWFLKSVKSGWLERWKRQEITKVRSSIVASGGTQEGRWRRPKYIRNILQKSEHQLNN